MNFGKRIDEPTSKAIVDRALERGITGFDTANMYSEGESERVLGRALRHVRDRVSVATKVGAWKNEGLRPERVTASLDESLDRLGMSEVDVYYLHVPDHKTPIKETLSAMREVLASGKARAWGVSNYASWQVLQMLHLADELGMARPVIAQQLYNAVHRELDIEHFAFLRAYPMHLTSYNALAGGLLTGQHAAGVAKGSRLAKNPMYTRRYATAAMLARRAELEEVAADEGMSLIDLAYAFVASQPQIDSVLVGPASIAHLDAACDGLARTLAQPTLARLDALYRGWLGSDTHYAR